MGRVTMPDIYGTLGPGCADEAVLRQMFSFGMTGMRLNLSHGSLKEFKEMIHGMQRAAAACGVRPQLLLDLQGPELRTGVLPAPLFLKEGETVRLGEKGIPMQEMVLGALLPEQKLLLDDGKLLLEVRECTEIPGKAPAVSALVLRGGVLKNRKSVALPGLRLYPPALTEADLENLKMAAEYGVTAVMQPFVRNRADLREVREALLTAGGGAIRLFAKIENLDGVRQIDELLPAADEIVIARGDLGNAVPLWKLPALQKFLAKKCREAQKPFMVVTQLLASMEQNPVPTRAEVSDIFNAVLDGAASLMVTGETAAGRYPAEAVRYLAETAASAAEWLRHDFSLTDLEDTSEDVNEW
ncbi:MAG: pyruvate kinase [Lachnospiraceae bacterium]|nr:pyruvate kinase [Lachnospiraceae bacterium]